MRRLASLPLIIALAVGCTTDEDFGPASDVTDVEMVALVADNETGDVDENDQTEDWVDIANSGQDPISLQGWTLTDDPGSDDPWTFPDVQLQAGTTLRVWCDEDPEDGELHATFKLSKDGESLVLYDAGGGVVDSVTWPSLGPDEVYEREGSTWQIR